MLPQGLISIIFIHKFCFAFSLIILDKRKENLHFVQQQISIFIKLSLAIVLTSPSTSYSCLIFLLLLKIHIYPFSFFLEILFKKQWRYSFLLLLLFFFSSNKLISIALFVVNIIKKWYGKMNIWRAKWSFD